MNPIKLTNRELSAAFIIQNKCGHKVNYDMVAEAFRLADAIEANELGNSSPEIIEESNLSENFENPEKSLKKWDVTIRDSNTFIRDYIWPIEANTAEEALSIAHWDLESGKIDLLDLDYEIVEDNSEIEILYCSETA